MKSWSLLWLVVGAISVGTIKMDRAYGQSSATDLQVETLGPVMPGARPPFVTIEAEDSQNKTNGILVRAAPGFLPGTPEGEASGRAYVALRGEGQWLQFANVSKANAIVVRYCIPDSPQGGGITATLSLYVNGQKRQGLTLSSAHTWLYGNSGKNPQAQNPSAGMPHVFWDESRFRLKGDEVKKGDLVTLQIDSTDSAAFYYIDLIDLEEVGAPLAQPDASLALSVKDFGATGDGVTDDTVAIADCIAAAKVQNKSVWIPSGNYIQTAQFQLDGVTVRGAGMWYTTLIGTVQGKTWAGNVGFKLIGNKPAVFDLSIDSPVHTYRSTGGKAFIGNASNWKVRNVWITHAMVGFWMGGATDGELKDCRVRFTYADGINLNGGSSRNIVENNSVRGCGDDGIALLSDLPAKPSARNEVRHNTVTAIWWGSNCDLAGGLDQVIKDNYLADNAGNACMAVNLPGAYPMNPLISGQVRDNVIVRGGGLKGTVWVYPGSTSIENLVFESNHIEDALGNAIELAGSHEQSVTFIRNTIRHPNKGGVFIRSTVVGVGIFTDNKIDNSGATPFVNQATPNFRLQQTGNSWQ